MSLWKEHDIIFGGALSAEGGHPFLRGEEIQRVGGGGRVGLQDSGGEVQEVKEDEGVVNKILHAEGI